MESSRLKKSLWFRTWRWWWDLIWGFIWRPETRTSIQTERRARKWSLPLVADVTIRTRPHLRLSFEDLSLGPRSRQKGRPDNWSGDPDRWLPTFRSGWDLIQGSNLKTRDEDLSLYRRGGGWGWDLIWGSHLRTWDEDLNPDRKPRRKWSGSMDSDVMIRMRPHLRLSFEDLRRGFQFRIGRPGDAGWGSEWDLIWGSRLKTWEEDLNPDTKPGRKMTRIVGWRHDDQDETSFEALIWRTWNEDLNLDRKAGGDGVGTSGDGWGWASCDEETLLPHKVGVFSGSNFAALCVSSLRQWLLHLYIFARTSRFQF
jgi:hypothetical protein